jgi:tRNA modification GTPase
MLETDTVAALSSASGSSRTAIVRVSGPQAVEIVGSFCSETAAGSVPGFHLSPVLLHLPEVGAFRCELLVFRAPASYTTEDVAEIHLHGSPILGEKLLLALCATGARPARPGEFTRRAYLGGRIDLAQAEAVCAVINSRSAAELRGASRALTGELSRLLAAAADELGDLLALLEASIDFSDQDVETAGPGEVENRIRSALSLLDSLKRNECSRRSDMPRMLICGAANVGKSSLFNLLVGRERVLTSPVAGTTRDIVAAELELAGSRILLLDSAGQADATGTIETLAAGAFRDCLETADAAIFVTEAHRPLAQRELELFKRIECRKLLVANKSDMGIAPEHSGVLCISCLRNEGLEKLRSALAHMIFSGVERYPDALVFSVRQQDAIARSVSALERARNAVEAELVAQDVREALDAIGEITGEVLSEEVLDRIFDRFCIGK